MKYLAFTIRATLFVLCILAVGAGGYAAAWYRYSGQDFGSAFVSKPSAPTPLTEFSFPSLRARLYPARDITILSELPSTSDTVKSYLYSAPLLERTMTGQLLIPATVTTNTPIIVMLRGYVPPASYTTGVGTRNAAFAVAKAGFITVAPDFYGFGGSDAEPPDAWQARFEKPAAVIELINSVREQGVPLASDSANLHKTNKIGIWGHSNGGQIALSTKVIMREPVPTTLWAPVTAPFPYSVLYFSDEAEDEGRGVRIWISQLEDQYDLRQFSFTQYLDGLTGPLQIQHGTNDDAALPYWSREFRDKVMAENARRSKATTPTDATTSTETSLPPTTLEYFEYPGADHNLQPGSNWSQAVERDITFFRTQLSFPAAVPLE